MDRDRFFHFENFRIGYAIASGANTGLSCWASPEGLPPTLLQSGVGFDLPPVYMRMTSTDADHLQAYLEKEVGLVEGEDFLRHGNGQRGGERYIDFIKPDIAERFEHFMAERGIKPGETPQNLAEYYSPERTASREQERQALLEIMHRENAKALEKRQRAAERKARAEEHKGPLSFLRFVTKSPPRSR